MKNIAVKYGVIGGLLLIVFILFQYFTNTLANIWLGFVPMVALIAVIVLSVKKTKAANGGFISFKNAFIAAFTTGVIISLFSIAFQFILFNVIDPDLPLKMESQMIENTVQMMEKFNAPESSIDDTVGQIQGTIKDAYTPVGLFSSFIKGVIFYAFLALVIALILKTPADQIRPTENEVLDI